MAKSYDYEAASAGLAQLKSALDSVQTQANTYVSTIQGAADENSAKAIKTLVDTFQDSLKAVVTFFEQELVAKADEAVATIGAIVEANG